MNGDDNILCFLLGYLVGRDDPGPRRVLTVGDVVALVVAALLLVGAIICAAYC
ncbi:MAG: hypothetical protein IIY62_03075 [Kiritimatiellae bacterium]|nr:hypothetical protein [Kiritimatiellia bacterium]